MGVPSSGFDPEHRFFSSWLLPPLAFGVLRLFFALFGWANIFASWGWEGTHDAAEIGKDFSYFTNLTWWGLTFYMTISAFHTFVYATKGYTWLDRWGRILQMLHSLFYTTIVTYPFLVTIVFWAVLYNGKWFPDTFDAFSNVRT